MRYLYSILIFLISPLLGIIQLKTKRGRIRFFERFGFWNIPIPAAVTWFHGASVGEIKGIAPIVRAFKRHHPERPILVTVTSTTAIPEAQKIGDFVRVLPFDSIIFYRVALRNLQIKGVVIGETELWPGLLHFLEIRNNTVVWVNARISEKTTKGIRFLQIFFGAMMQPIRKFFITDPIYRGRFLRLGVAPEKIIETINTKYIREPLTRSEARQQCPVPSDCFVVTIGNIRGEEGTILFPAAMGAAKRNGLVFIVPRHPESFEKLKRELHEASEETLQPVYDSFESYLSHLPTRGVVFVDRFGILESIYAQSSLVISAGSFASTYQGHNLLEAAPYGTLLVTGPYNGSTESLLARLQEKKAVIVSETAEDIISVITAYTENPGQFDETRMRYREFWKQYQNIPESLLEAIATI